MELDTQLPMRITFAITTTLVALALAPLASAQICSGPIFDAPISASFVKSSGGALWMAGYNGALGGYRVARFDGVDWTVLPGVFNGQVLTVVDTSFGVVAGGAFASVDGTPRARVAAFDGTSWQALGNGVDGASSTRVRAVAEHAGQLYIGGEFQSVSGVTSANVAGWDGATWSSLQGGVDRPVADLESFGGRLVVAGEFTHAGGSVLQSVAGWDGSIWTSVGTSVLPAVTDLTQEGARLYAAAGQLQSFAGVDWQLVGAPTNQFAVEHVGVLGNQILVHGRNTGFCLSFSNDPCLSRRLRVGGTWSNLPTDDIAPVTASQSIAVFQGAFFESGTTNGVLAWSSTAKLQSYAPLSGPWYAATNVTFQVECLDPLAPVSVQFGSLPPLAGVITGAKSVKVTIPANWFTSAGPTALRFEQNGAVTHVPNGYSVRPFLDVSSVTFFSHYAAFRVRSASASGSAWILWGAQLTSPYSLADVFGLGLLDLTSFGVLGVGNLGPDNAIFPTLAIDKPLGSIPPGLTFPVQALVVEYTANGPLLSITNPGVVAF